MELHESTLVELRDELRKGAVSSDDLIKHFGARIEAIDSGLRAFLDREVSYPLRDNDADSAIAGIPFATKPNIVIAGREATASSKVLQGFRSPYTATSIKKLLSAGGVAMGYTNCDEFGMGSSTENSAYQVTRNPWDYDRVPGGSSGGSAAAVAAGLIPYALGSDTGGSVRQPAAFCGIVGLKPTYGRVSRYGLMALASSFDTIGPLTRTVGDAALVMNYLAGHDSQDATTVAAEVPDYTQSLTKGVEGLRIGVPKEFFEQGLADNVGQAVREAIKQFESLGAEIVEVSLPNSLYALAAYYLILPVEASANFSRYDGIRYQFRAPDAQALSDIYTHTRGQGFGSEVKRRIMLGTFASSSGYYDAYYKQALDTQQRMKADFKSVFEKVDVLVGPTAPSTAFKIGEKVNDPMSMWLTDVYSVNANVVGIPAMSIPCGFSEGLPIGLQLMAPWLREDVLFQTAAAYEASTDWHTQRPDFSVANKN